MDVVEKGEPMPILSLGEGKNMVTQLILVNLTVFILLFFTQVVYNIEGNSTIRFNLDVMNNVILPASFSRLARLPWTFITSLFVHESVWMVFGNMIWLWAFGSLLQRKAGPGVILPLYLFGGLIGNLLYMLGMQLIPSFHLTQFFATYYGSTAGVMSMAVATLLIAPNVRIFQQLSGGIPMWIVTILYIIMAVAAHLFSHHDLTYLPAVTGGAVFGFLFMNAWKKGNDWGAGFNKALHTITHIFHPKGN
jgi:membrane associated rhomboid family serine protease